MSRLLVDHAAALRARSALAVTIKDDGDRSRESLLIRCILPIIPRPPNRKMPEHPDYGGYRDRNLIERMFNMLNQARRIATRYDKTAPSFASFPKLASARLWLNLMSTRHSSRGPTSEFSPWQGIRRDTPEWGPGLQHDDYGGVCARCRRP
jgi:hypothetical protein